MFKFCVTKNRSVALPPMSRNRERTFKVARTQSIYRVSEGKVSSQRLERQVVTVGTLTLVESGTFLRNYCFSSIGTPLPFIGFLPFWVRSSCPPPCPLGMCVLSGLLPPLLPMSCPTFIIFGTVTFLCLSVLNPPPSSILHHHSSKGIGFSIQQFSTVDINFVRLSYLGRRIIKRKEISLLNLGLLRRSNKRRTIKEINVNSTENKTI